MKNTGAKTFSKARVKSVVSTNVIQLLGPVDPKTGLHREIRLILWGLRAPPLGDRRDEAEQPMAFFGKERLRRLLVGQTVEFIVDLRDDEKNTRLGRILLDDKDLGVLVLEEGLAEPKNLDDQGEKKFRPENLDEYKEAAEIAKTKKVGIYSPQAGTQIRKKYQRHGQTSSFVASEFLKSLPQGPLQAYIEDFFAPSYLLVYLPTLETHIRSRVAGLFLPSTPPEVQAAARKEIEAEWIQRDLLVEFKSYEEKGDFFGVGLAGEVGTRLLGSLVEKGLGKLESSAVMVMKTDEFTKMKQLQIEAQKNKVGVWREEEAKGGREKVGQSLASNEVFEANVLEVHSGDSLTVLPLKSGSTPQRIFLSSIRAPAMGNVRREELHKPWAHEAREFLRRASVGKKVRVEIEYTRKVIKKETENDSDSETPVKSQKPEPERLLTFASVFLVDKADNLAQLVVEKGFATVMNPRADDPCSNYFKALKDTEEIAKLNKTGVHSTKNPIIHRLVDLTTPEKHGKAKQNFEYIKGEKKLKGMIESVISGSRFKVFFEKANCYAIVGLSGVRTLRSDKNIPDHAFFADKALEYARDHMLNRDVEIDLENVDKRGAYYGFVSHNKRGFAEVLLEQGLAYTEFIGKEAQGSRALFSDIEAEAKKKKVGIWSRDVKIKAGDLAEEEKSDNYETLEETHEKALVTEIVDGNSFYVQLAEESGRLDKVMKEIEAAVPKAQPLERPVKIGTPCLAEFDGGWHRATVTHLRKDEKYEVFFSDYGNTDIVRYAQLKKTTKSLVDAKALARRCRLAYIESPDIASEEGEIAGECLRKLIWEAPLSITHIGKIGNEYDSVVHIFGKTGLKMSVNYAMVKNGASRVDPEAVIPKDVADELEAAQTLAKKTSDGVWQFANPFRD
jgi:staphylococcal nuclease domain-containing protein 1